MPQRNATPERLYELDGLRGWAALSVMLFHFLWETFGVRFPVFQSAPLSPFLNGGMAVSIFFVLSGQALSAAYWRTRDGAALGRMALVRHLRLTIPILAACALVYVLLVAGLSFATPAAAVLRIEDWLGRFLHFTPSLEGLLRFALADVYFEYHTGAAYIPFLWTMHIELIGSFLVFAFLPLARRTPWPGLVMAALGVVGMIADEYYGAFLIGAAFGRAEAAGVFAGARVKRWAAPLSAIAIAAALVYAGHAQFNSVPDRAVKVIVAAVILVAAVQCNAGAVRLLRMPASRFLGAQSFMLYLVHFAVLISLTSWLVVAAEARGALTPLTALGIAIVSASASFALAMAFAPVERFTHRVCRAVGRLSRPAPRLAEASDRVG